MNQPDQTSGAALDEALRVDERRPRSAAVERVVERWFDDDAPDTDTSREAPK